MEEACEGAPWIQGVRQMLRGGRLTLDQEGVELQEVMGFSSHLTLSPR